MIARVGGRAITQADFDRVAIPYFARLQSELGAGFEGDIRKTANHNVLDELLRRELLALEAQRLKIEPTQAEIDEILIQDPFFRTPDGKIDRTKFEQFKLSPGSNYLQILPQLRESAALNRLDRELRQRYTPTAAQVRDEWAKRNDQMRLKLFPLLTRDMSLDPEASEAERADYYRAHPDQFLRRTKLRLKVARLPLPAEGDSTRDVERAKALTRARGIADSMRAGTLADTASWLLDTGLFDVPAATLPRIGRSPEMSAEVARADTESTVRVLGPHTLPDAVVVAVVAERQPKHVPPLREVIGDVKRRADIEKRRQVAEAERRAFHVEHSDRYVGPRATVTRLIVPPDVAPVRTPSPREIERWYAQNGHTLLPPDHAGDSAVPALNDSLRVVARSRMEAEQRTRRTSEALAQLSRGFGTTRDPRALARSQGATAETLTFTRGTPDTLFPPTFVDTLLLGGPALRGEVRGPRSFGDRWVLWRVDAADTAFVPPFEAVRARVESDFAAEQRQKGESVGRSHYQAHRDRYKTPVKYTLSYVAVKIPSPDSVRIVDADVRKHYDANPAQFRQEEEVHARHLLLSTREGNSESVAKARADSLLGALKRGADFVELAKAFSQEPGAASSGGDLGWFGRNRMVKEFEEAAFKLEPGQMSPVVKTMFGYHIIKLEERRPAGTKPFDDVKAQIRAQLAQQRGDSTALRAANAVRRRLAAGESPAVVAARHGGVVTSAPIAATEPIPVLGYAQGLQQDLPSLGVGRWSAKPYRAGSQYAVVRVDSRRAPRPAEFDEVKAQAIEDAKTEQRRAKLDAQVAAVRAALAAGATLDSVAAPWGGLRETGPINSTAMFLPVIGNEPRVSARAFAMKPGEHSDTLRVANGVVWVQVEEKTPADASAFKTAEPQIRAELLQKRMNEWLEAHKKTAAIEILRPDLREPRPSPFKTVTMSTGG